jgi:hypothetical protein
MTDSLGGKALNFQEAVANSGSKVVLMANSVEKSRVLWSER